MATLGRAVKMDQICWTNSFIRPNRRAFVSESGMLMRRILLQQSGKCTGSSSTTNEWVSFPRGK
ncbi:hypothetical protein PIB30_049574, partial [Stylosanthes scabra]|nr:hypothetical protein [Stylosanthes scabra]